MQADGKKVIIIGSGVSGLAAAAVLAKGGWQVTLLERNATTGGRARTWSQDGFLFDMGPSFYWMPDVFERFFNRFHTTTAEQYGLCRLDPSYSVIYGQGDRWALPAGRSAVAALFEQEERGAGNKLNAFLDEAAVKYRVGMQDVVYRPSLSWREYLDPAMLEPAQPGERPDHAAEGGVIHLLPADIIGMRGQGGGLGKVTERRSGGRVSLQESMEKPGERLGK